MATEFFLVVSWGKADPQIIRGFDSAAAAHDWLIGATRKVLASDENRDEDEDIANIPDDDLLDWADEHFGGNFQWMITDNVQTISD